jgi:hypothetical protein
MRSEIAIVLFRLIQVRIRLRALIICENLVKCRLFKKTVPDFCFETYLKVKNLNLFASRIT